MWPGTPYPLGATYDGAGTNFAVFSEAAERVGERVPVPADSPAASVREGGNACH